MVKIRALVTLVVGKNKEISPGTVCDVSEDEAKRLVERNFAERITKETNQQGKDDDKSDENSGGQPIQTTGEDCEV
ncbi:MAG: hypothetical protein NC218_04435 [Acetobacter sp.]|nr:hypothetical protein [Acetobacter sp.]